MTPRRRREACLPVAQRGTDEVDSGVVLRRPPFSVSVSESTTSVSVSESTTERRQRSEPQHGSRRVLDAAPVRLRSWHAHKMARGEIVERGVDVVDQLAALR